MQASVLAVGLLVYAGATLDAWQVLPVGNGLRWKLTVLFPGLYLALTLVGALAIPAARRAITRHLWLSYRTGFGQTVISVLVGLGLLVVLAGVIVWQVHRPLAHGGASPGGAFSGFGAGLGLLIAQVVLLRALEADPAVRDLIGRRD